MKEEKIGIVYFEETDSIVLVINKVYSGTYKMKNVIDQINDNHVVAFRCIKKHRPELLI